MMRRLRVHVAAVVAVVVLTGAASAQLGSLLKGAGVGLLVSQFGGQINRALNGLTRTQGETMDYKTKVVPIISVGSGKEVGACQIMGPHDAVDSVKLVGQIEGKFDPVGLRIRALVPMAAKSFTDIKRVPGVGISGLIDIKI